MNRFEGSNIVFRLILSALILCAFCPCVLGNGGVDVGWDIVFGRDPAASGVDVMDPDKAFEGRKNHSWGTAKNAQALVHWSAGAYSKAASTWLELVEWSVKPVTEEEDSILRSPEFLEGYLAALEEVDRYYRVSAEAVPLYNDLAETTDDDFKVNLLREYVLRAYEINGDYEAFSTAADKVGLIRHWTGIAGSFGRCASGDLEYRFPPEYDPNGASYDCGGTEIRWRELLADSPLGYVDFNELLDPVPGIGYAKTVLFCGTAMDVVLTLESDADVRVWLNGQLVISRNERLERDTEDPIRILVGLKSGENSILVKAGRRYGSWSFRLFARPMMRESIWEAVWEPVGSFPSCSPKESRSVGRRLEPGLADLETDDATEDDESKGTSEPSLSGTDVLRHFYLSLLYLRNGRYDKSRYYSGRLEDEYPQWSLPIVLKGWAFTEESQRRPASKVRLENESRKEYEKALDLSTGLIPPSVGLGEYYRRRETYDKALDVLGEVKKRIDRETAEVKSASGEYAEPAYRLALVYEDLKYEIEARNNYREAIDDGIGRPDAWVGLVETLKRGGAPESALESAGEGANLFPGHYGLALLEAQLSRQCGEAVNGLDKLSNWIAYHPNHTGARREKAALLASLGRFDEALGEYDRIAEIVPSDADAYLDAARLCFAVSEWNDAKDLPMVLRGRNYFLEAKKREPQNTAIWRSIAEADRFINRMTAPDTAPVKYVFPDEMYDLDVLTMDQSGLQSLPQEKADYVNLIDLMVVVLLPNGTRFETVHRSTLLKNTRGRTSFSDVEVPGDAEILTARTITSKKDTYDAGRITDTGGNKSISMYGLEDGCIVDYAYRQAFTSPPYPGTGYANGRFYFGEYDNPTLLAKFVVLVPPGVKIDWRSNPLSFAPAIQSGDEWTAYIWEMKNIAGLKSEQQIPEMALVVSTVEFTTCPNWGIEIENSKAALRGRVEDDGSLAELSSLIGMAAETRDKRIDDVYDYIRTNIEPSQFGGATTLDTYKNQAGGVFDRTMLAKQLLENLGVGSYFTATYDLSAGKTFPPLPQLNYLGRSHLFIPGDAAGDVFPALAHPSDRSVAFTSRYASVDEMADTKIEAGIRFHFTPKGTILAPPISDPPSQGWVERHLEVEIAPGSDLVSCKGRFYYHGALRAGIRKMIVDVTTREQVVSAEANRVLRGFLLESGQFEGVEDLAGNLAVRIEGSLKGFVEEAEEGYRFDPLPDKSGLAGKTKEPDRVHPLEFDETVLYNPAVSVFRLPESGNGSDWVFSNVPDDVFLISRFGYYSLDYEVKDGELWVLRAAYVPKQWIEAEDYPEFQGFCRSVETAEQTRVGIQRRTD